MDRVERSDPEGILDVPQFKYRGNFSTSRNGFKKVYLRFFPSSFSVVNIFVIEYISDIGG